MKESGLWNSILQLKKIAPLLLFLIPYSIVFIIYLFIGDENCAVIDIWSKINVHHAFYKSIDSRIALLLGFVMALFGVYIVFIKEQSQLVDNLKNKIDNILNKSKIIFESGINEFNDEHLSALQRILIALNKLEKNTPKLNGTLSIYSIDNSDPRSWWSDTMTGYLALLSNWKSMDNEDNRRVVHRIFVCQKNELLSPVFAKTISLHSLMGFKTYVITYPLYKNILDSVRKSNKNQEFPEKEVLIWTNTIRNENNEIENKPIPIDFNLDKSKHSKSWKSVKCYQSFWEINDDNNYRNMLINKELDCDLPNFYKRNINSKSIELWFEFIAKEKPNDTSSNKHKTWEKIPISYIFLIQELIKNMICCKDDNEVKNINDKIPFGIEIKTSECSPCVNRSNCRHIMEGNGVPFDFTSPSNVRKILKEYYYKLN